MEEREFKADVIADGRITIPTSLRKKLNIKQGDVLKVQIVEVVHF